MTEDQVIELMKSSKSEQEWNANCDKVISGARMLMKVKLMKRYGGRSHGFLGYMTPLLHPIRWSKAIRAHGKVCRISDYLWQQRPRNYKAWRIVSNKTWVLFYQLTDWL